MKKRVFKLQLNKKTVNNLYPSEMKECVAGHRTRGNNCNTQNCPSYTCNPCFPGTVYQCSGICSGGQVCTA